jgi:hypothetical protein
LRLGIGIGVTSPLCVGRTRGPANLFRGSDTGFWVDPSAQGTLSQDVAGSIPVTAFGQPIGRIMDRSARGNHATQATAAAQPTYARMPVGGRRNRLVNSGSGGAVVGVIGSGGALPTGWGMAQSLAREVVAIGEIGSIPYFDLRLTGTFTGGYFLNFSASNVVDAAAGQTWTASIYAQALGAVVGADALFVQLSSRLGDGSPKFAYPRTTIGFPGTFTRFATPAATLLNTDGAAGSVAFAIGFLRLDCTGTVDVTLRLGGRQVEQASAASLFQTVNGTADVSEVGKADRFAILDDLLDDTLAATLPAGTYTVAHADDAGVTILTGQALSAAYTIPGPRRLFGAVAINRALDVAETTSLTAWLTAKRP